MLRLATLALPLLLHASAPGQQTPTAPKAPSAARADTPARATNPPNRLARETSPYLLLHAHNPVDWYPWCEEALARAKRENKPIFLSVGYSSCHWCHVMERESFLDAEIARFLNEHFVCIKVDREERPDLDAIYMSALQIYNQATGNGRGGGWPMSMFLTPECKPFFGGTYFPARDGDRGVTTGFLTLVQRIHEFWTGQPDRIRGDADTLTQLVQRELDSRRGASAAMPAASLLPQVLEALGERYDPEWGGFGFAAAQPNRPKFPEPSNLLFLVDRLQSRDLPESQRQRAQEMLEGTLDRMAQGGIRDHLGGGFHRYSVDRFWRIPHFEKMLYDNGQLATVYTEAFLVTGREDYRHVVEELLAFVQRELTADEGSFYSALDAESEHEEGKYYRWEKAEFEQLPAGPARQLFLDVYGLTAEPNFEGQYYVPQLRRNWVEVAQGHQQTPAELDATLRPVREQLLAIRAARPRPLTDTKVLTSWNGLMIRGFADAGRGLENPAYTATAARAARFVLDRMRTPDGRLLRTYAQGQARLNAYLDDYAFFIDGLLALYRATGDRTWLTAADGLMSKQIEWYWDSERGGFFFTSDDHESLIARGMDPVDGSEPSGNSVSADNLLFLAAELDRADYREKGQQTIQALAGIMTASPAAAPRLAVALSRWLALPPPGQPPKN
ncbi:MAG: thioredoxin domain-containing protein [Pirellulaceae bacterium]